MSEPEDKFKAQADAEFAAVQRHVEQLGELYENVQIFCSRHDQGELGGTRTICIGSGNWFARMGQITEWLEREREKIRLEVKAQQEGED